MKHLIAFLTIFFLSTTLQAETAEYPYSILVSEKNIETLNDFFLHLEQKELSKANIVYKNIGQTEWYVDINGKKEYEFRGPSIIGEPRDEEKFLIEKIDGIWCLSIINRDKDDDADGPYIKWDVSVRINLKSRIVEASYLERIQRIFPTLTDIGTTIPDSIYWDMCQVFGALGYTDDTSKSFINVASYELFEVNNECFEIKDSLDGFWIKKVTCLDYWERPISIKEEFEDLFVKFIMKNVWHIYQENNDKSNFELIRVIDLKRKKIWTNNNENLFFVFEKH